MSSERMGSLIGDDTLVLGPSVDVSGKPWRRMGPSEDDILLRMFQQAVCRKREPMLES